MGVLLAGTPAAADVLLPGWYAFLEAQAMTGMIPAILLIEAVLARRILALSLVRTLAVAVSANVASAALGLPLVSLLAGRGLRGIGHPHGGDGTLAALMLLCLPCFLLSAWVETHVARWLVPPDRRQWCGRWSLEANLASYVMMECVLVVLAIAVAMWRRQGLIP